MHTYKWETVDHHIVMVAKDGESLKNKIHNLAISIMSHWANHPKDGPEAAIKLTALQEASPYHRKAFADWMAVKSGMSWSEEKETWYVQKGQKCKKDQLDAARNEPFWEVSPPPKANPLTDEMILKTLQGILDKQKKHEKNPVDGDAFSKAGNESLRAAIEAWKAKVS